MACFLNKVLTPISTTSGLWSTGNTRKYQQIDIYIYQCEIGCAQPNFKNTGAEQLFLAWCAHVISLTGSKQRRTFSLKRRRREKLHITSSFTWLWMKTSATWQTFISGLFKDTLISVRTMALTECWSRVGESVFSFCHSISLYYMSRGMRFPTIWQFNKCRLGRASAASF